MEPNKKSLLKSPIKVSFYFLFTSWCIIILGLVIWSREGIYSETMKLAQREAYKGYEKDVMFRAWATMHGGVYVPVSDETPPNPYLANIPDREITTVSGKKLTLMNPAYITRQLHELSFKKLGIKGHITSLTPIRKENAPDKWEINALEEFEKGIKEVSGFDTLENEKYFRFMAPLITGEGCLKCHSAQGYKTGDIRGGISSSISWESYEASIVKQTTVLYFGYGILWLLGIIGLVTVKKKFVIYLARRDQDELEMRKLNEDLRSSKSRIEENLIQKHLLVEELTETKEKLEKINSEKDKFFSIIAHDLRSPFIGLLSLTELMANKSQDFTIDEFTDLSRSLNNSAVNVYKLLNNLLEWSQMQQNAVSFNSGKIDLLTLISSNLSILAQRASQKNISVQNEISIPVFVSVDEKMINAVLRNLLSNAVKFTETGGKVTISAKPVENNMFEISVTDTGIGIAEENLSRLFQLGENIKSKGTEGELSTGLGLILCKEFVESHGGKIWASSKLGQGSTFYFTIPKA